MKAAKGDCHRRAAVNAEHWTAVCTKTIKCNSNQVPCLQLLLYGLAVTSNQWFDCCDMNSMRLQSARADSDRASCLQLK